MWTFVSIAVKQLVKFYFKLRVRDFLVEYLTLLIFMGIFVLKYFKTTFYLTFSHVSFRMSSNENQTCASCESSLNCVQWTRFVWVITWYFTTVENRLHSHLGIERLYTSVDLWYYFYVDNWILLPCMVCGYSTKRTLTYPLLLGI